MLEVRCYHCEKSDVVDESATFAPCSACGQPMHVTTARRLLALERVSQLARDDTEFSQSVCSDLHSLVGYHRRELLALAPTPSVIAPVSPRPLPVPPPLPTASVTTLSSAAPEQPLALGARPHPIPTGPSLWSRLGPLFAENLLFALAGFLLLAGAVYFTTTAWTTMSGATQKLVVAVGLLLFAGMLHGASTVLGREQGLRTAARVLSLVAIALAPAASIVAGRLLDENVTLALVTAAAATGAGHWFLHQLLARERHAPPAAVHVLIGGLLFASVFANALLPLRLLASCAAGAATILVAVLQRRSARNNDTSPNASSACVLLAASFAAIALCSGIALAYDAPIARAIAPLGIVIAAATVAAVMLESTRSLRAPSVLTAALAVAISAVLIATGDLRCVMVAAWCAAATWHVVSLRLDRARVLIPALVLSAIGYLLLPAPMRELAAQLRAEAASQLGYEPQRLPLSFYGITFLPYLLGLAILGLWFRRAERSAHRTVTSVWAMIVAGSLATMSLTLGDDLRAPMAVLPADGLLLVLVGYLGRSSKAVLMGCVGVIGGLVCALCWFEAPPGVAAAFGSAATLLLLSLGRYASSHGGFGIHAARSIRQVALSVGVVTAAWALVGAWPIEHQRPWNVLFAAVVVAVLALLRTPSPMRRAGRRLAWLLPLLLLPSLWATAIGVAAALEWTGVATVRASLPAALALVTAVMPMWWWWLPRGAKQRDNRMPLVGAMIALQAVLLPDLFAGYQQQIYPLSAITGAALLAAATGWLALRTRCDLLLGVAIITAALPLHLMAGALLGNAASPAGLVGPTALALVVSWRKNVRVSLQSITWGMSAIAAALLLLMRMAALPQIPVTEQTLASLVTALLLIVTTVRHASTLQSNGSARKTALTIAGAIGAVLLPISLLDLIATSHLGYAIGALVVAAFSMLAAHLCRRSRVLATVLSLHGLSFVALATLLLFFWQPADTTEHVYRMLLLVAATIAAAACRPRSLRTATTLIAAIASIGAFVVQPLELHWLRYEWSVALTLSWCTLALFASAQPRWQSRAFALRLLTLPALVIVALGFSAWSIYMVLGEHSRQATDAIVIDCTAIAFVAAGLASSRHLATRWRTATCALATAIALCATTPINGLLNGHRNTHFRPDAELALLAIAFAVFALRNARLSAFALASLALLLTAFDLYDLSTPISLTLLAGVPLALLLRGQSGPLALLHGVILLLAAWSWIAFAGHDAAPLAPWLALSAAVLASTIGPWLRHVTGDALPAGQQAALRAGVLVAASGALLWTCVQAIAPMPAGQLGAALLTCGMLAVSGARAASSPKQAPMVQFTLFAVISTWLLLARGTAVLAVLDGSHHHALTVLGVTLFLISGRRRSPNQQQLRGAAVAATLGASLLSVGLGGLTFSLLAGAMVLGLGAVLGRARWLGALALLLANWGLFHLWLRQGVFDPSFYGVPAGLSLVFGAELARPALERAKTTALRVTGLAVLYGSVLVQIARVSVPLHALGLFVMAMAAVAWGARQKHTALLVTGAIAVVLDVIVYLAQRGFEQDFTGSVLLVGAGCGLFLVAVRTAKRRAARPADE